MENENDLVNYFIKRTKPYAACTKLENLKRSGTADLLFSCFGKHNLIEFKFKRDWPKRESTFVKFKHFTIPQQRFLGEHGVKGGSSYVCVGVGVEIFIMDWLHTTLIVKGGTREDYFNTCSVYLSHEFDKKAWDQAINHEFKYRN